MVPGLSPMSSANRPRPVSSALSSARSTARPTRRGVVLGESGGLGMRSTVQGLIQEMIAGNGSGDRPGNDGPLVAHAPTRPAYSFADPDRAVSSPIRRSCFEQQHPPPLVLRKSIREHAARRPSPDHDEIVSVRLRHHPASLVRKAEARFRRLGFRRGLPVARTEAPPALGILGRTAATASPGCGGVPPVCRPDRPPSLRSTASDGGHPTIDDQRVITELIRYDEMCRVM